MRISNAAILFAVLAASACTPQTNQANPAPTAAPSPAAVAPVQTVVKSDNGMLTVDPGVLSQCAGAPEAVASTISWDATSSGAPGVEVWMQQPGEEKKLWSAAPVTGSDKTGPWMRAGSEIVLMDARDKKELAKIVLQAVPCPQQ